MKKRNILYERGNVICFGKIRKHCKPIPHISVNISRSLLCRLLNIYAKPQNVTTIYLTSGDINENQFFKIKHAFEKGVIYIMFYNSRTNLKFLTKIKTFRIKDLTPKLYIYGLKRVYDVSWLID